MNLGSSDAGGAPPRTGSGQPLSRAIDERRSHGTLILVTSYRSPRSIDVHMQRSGSVAVEEPLMIVDVTIVSEAPLHIQRRFTFRRTLPGKGEIAAVLLDGGTPVAKVESEFVELATSADMRGPLHRPVDITTAEALVVMGGIGIAFRNRRCEVLLGISNIFCGDILVGVLVAVSLERMVKHYLYPVEHFVLSPVRPIARDCPFPGDETTRLILLATVVDVLRGAFAEQLIE
ncbi:hypothetical protein DL764_000849 [Monosporascus ibericus]|uniref:Uncharacterized protein n=1 Tax=Monosporascus ibericus TaxID=155417 RepID=A0A4V1XCL2_9PEZI|nr:hypothetical protein DL764_000849 [Monosporascus ibericus]